jgi:tetratricopeptide (TPR) repeat protein
MPLSLADATASFAHPQAFLGLAICGWLSYTRRERRILIVSGLNCSFFFRFAPLAGSAAAILSANLALSSAAYAQIPGASSSSSSSSSRSQNSSSSSGTPEPAADIPQQRHIAQFDAGGSAITLQTNEPLFDLAVSLNACGYDTDLEQSNPVRGQIRDEVNQALAASAAARDSRDALCQYIREHALNDSGRSLAQYVSLALYLKPPPELTPSVDETELPPDATQVVTVLPLVRGFAEELHLHALWAEHKPQYEALVDRVHDPLTKMVLNTNIYLHLPVSSYDGRRFLVLLEPMLAPSAINARIYASDYIVQVSPGTQPDGVGVVAGVPMDLIRHTYLHYEIEPLVYAKAQAMDRLLPLLRPVQKAPLEFSFKSDIVALLTECLIKSIEARTMDVGFPAPVRPSEIKQRTDVERYDADMLAYERKADVVRRQAVTHEMRQGWVLVGYFYDQLGAMEKDSISLKDNIGAMVYGMDVERERHSAEQIAFLAEGSGDPAFRDPVGRAPRQLTGLDLAEMKLMKGDVAGAGEMAEAALKANPASAQAHYLLGRIDLMTGDPDGALDNLNQTLTLSHDPRTIAWAHIYLGRLYDLAREEDAPEGSHPQRAQAVAEYKAALANRDSQPDTKLAAEKGIKEPFALPKRATPPGQEDDNAPLDPTGKAQKESYRPTPP